MDITKMLIGLLCMNCPRAGTVCKDNPPSYADAYRCKWNEADDLYKKIVERIEYLEAN